MKKIISYMLLVSMVFALSGCGTSNKNQERNYEHSMALMTDTGGINDEAFNQSAWEGAQKVKEDLNFDIRYIESKQVSDYKSNLDVLNDSNPDMIFVMGYTAADMLKDEAELNPDQHYTIIDYAYDEPIENVLSIRFRDSEPAFLMGYLAAHTTKSNKVGFVGGIKSETIGEFEYGFKAGVFYASKELNKDVKVDVQYIESFQDDTKGKAIANGMYSKGIDVVYAVAGNAGRGVIQAAAEQGKYVIGADKDQQYLAPKNVIGSTLKLSNQVVYNVCKDIVDVNDLSELTGRNKIMGLKDVAVDVVINKDLIDQDLINKVTEIKNKISDGSVNPPYNEDMFNNYIQNN